MAAHLWEECSFCRGASSPRLLASQFYKKCLFCRGKAHALGTSPRRPLFASVLQGIYIRKGPSWGSLLVWVFGPSGAGGGVWGAAKRLQAQRLEGRGGRKCFRSSTWRLVVPENAAGVAPGAFGVAKNAALEALGKVGRSKMLRVSSQGGLSAPKVLRS